MKIAFIGLGAMGRGMSKRLIGAGHEVLGHDVVPAATEALVKAGGRAAANAGEACRGADALIVMVFNAPRPWRLLVFLPAWATAIGFFQVSAKTCVALAARGLKNMDGGDEEITNPLELEAIRAQSRGVHIRAVVLAAVVAGLLAALP